MKVSHCGPPSNRTWNTYCMYNFGFSRFPVLQKRTFRMNSVLLPHKDHSQYQPGQLVQLSVCDIFNICNICSWFYLWSVILCLQHKWRERGMAECLGGNNRREPPSPFQLQFQAVTIYCQCEDFSLHLSYTFLHWLWMMQSGMLDSLKTFNILTAQLLHQQLWVFSHVPPNLVTGGRLTSDPDGRWSNSLLPCNHYVYFHHEPFSIIELCSF